ncbi:hypothetical protein ISCGN_033106 [Ixodes scapularis]
MSGLSSKKPAGGYNSAMGQETPSRNAELSVGHKPTTPTRRHGAAVSQRRAKRSFSRHGGTWIRGDMDTRGPSSSSNCGRSRQLMRCNQGDGGMPRREMRCRSVPSPSERSQLRRAMTGGRHIEPFGLPESSSRGAFWPARSEPPFGDIDMRRMEAVSWPPLVSLLQEEHQREDKRPYTNGSTSNASERSRSGNDNSSRHPTETTSLPCKTASGTHGSPNPPAYFSGSRHPTSLGSRSPQMIAAVPSSPEAHAAAPPPLFSTLPRGHATRAQCMCGHSGNSAEVLYDFHQKAPRPHTGYTMMNLTNGTAIFLEASTQGTPPFQDQRPDKGKSPNKVPIEAEEIPIDQSTTNPFQASAQGKPQGVGHPPDDITDDRQ